MNLIIDNNSSLVLLQTENEITVIDGAFAVDGIKVGISAATASVVVADPVTPFYPEVYTYINGAYAIANQERYDACNGQAKDLFNAKQADNRAAAYASESDPIFFKAQRGEATMDAWNAKVAEIKARFPYQQ